MPFHDKRELIFDADAIALIPERSPVSARRLYLPEGRPDGVRFRQAEGEVELLYGLGAGARSRTVQAESLAALLIAYGMRARLPLPRTATKGVAVRPDAVVLRLELAFAEPPEPLLPELQARPKPVPARPFAWKGVA
jgi:hypothetical protein